MKSGPQALFASLAMAALVLAACGSQTPAAESLDPVAVASSPIPLGSLDANPSEADSACPAPPFTLDEVSAVPVAERPSCFGTQDITLRGWVFQELNPVYDCVTFPDRPMWLMCVLARQPLLAFEQPPSEWNPGLRPLWVAADPRGPVGPIQFGAADGPVAINTWIEVTGHFDDPAAAACGPPGDPYRVECAGTLVLTAVQNDRGR